MPRIKKTDTSVSKHLMLPSTLVARVELELYSELEGKVPMGAWQEFLTGLIIEHFKAIDRKRRKEERGHAVAVSAIEGIPTSVLTDSATALIANL